MRDLLEKTLSVDEAVALKTEVWGWLTKKGSIISTMSLGIEHSDDAERRYKRRYRKKGTDQQVNAFLAKEGLIRFIVSGGEYGGVEVSLFDKGITTTQMRTIKDYVELIPNRFNWEVYIPEKDTWKIDTDFRKFRKYLGK